VGRREKGKIFQFRFPWRSKKKKTGPVFLPLHFGPLEWALRFTKKNLLRDKDAGPEGNIPQGTLVLSPNYTRQPILVGGPSLAVKKLGQSNKNEKKQE